MPPPRHFGQIMLLPAIQDFAAQAYDPACYARLPSDWWIAVADVTGSTKLANTGRDRDVNFVAGAVVAVLTETASRPEQPAACQFGGDGAAAAVPPECVERVRPALAALAHWAQREQGIPLRVGLVPVSALHSAGHEVMAALYDFGNGNVFGQFLGGGMPMAEHWVKTDNYWHVQPQPGTLPGVESLSCRWQPIPPKRGRIMCVIIDPANASPQDLSHIQDRLDEIVPTGEVAPLGDGHGLSPVLFPAWRDLKVELRTVPMLGRPFRLVKAVIGSVILGVVHRLGGKLMGIDTNHYVEALAERSDYRKQAGGPRMVLDVTPDEAKKVEEVLAEAEAQGLITFGTAYSDATTMTCMVGDFAADRHIHFVDGDQLGFWRAAESLKGKRGKKQPKGD